MKTRTVNITRAVLDALNRQNWLPYLIIAIASFGVSAPARGQEECSAPPLGIVRWYPADGDAKSLIGSHDGTLVANATFAPGIVTQAFSFDGAHDFVEAPAGPDLPTSSITLDAWVYLTSTTP